MSKSDGRAARPQRLPANPPPELTATTPFASSDYTLEFIGRIKHQLGTIEESIEILEISVEKQSEAVKRSEKDIYAAKKLVWFVVGIAAFVLNLLVALLVKK